VRQVQIAQLLYYIVGEAHMTKLLYPELSYQIVGAAMEVHRILGPGYLESVYEIALAHEMSLRSISFEQQRPLPVVYKGVLAGDYVVDFVVESTIVVEIKAVTMLHPRHQAQAINYLAGTGLKLAILLNFGADSLQHKRCINRNKVKE
jgi:GxxExxY protein